MYEAHELALLEKEVTFNTSIYIGEWSTKEKLPQGFGIEITNLPNGE